MRLESDGHAAKSPVSIHGVRFISLFCLDFSTTIDDDDVCYCWSFIFRKQIVIGIVPFFSIFFLFISFSFRLNIGTFWLNFATFDSIVAHLNQLHQSLFRICINFCPSQQTTTTTTTISSITPKTVIEEANWLTLYDDIQHVIGDGFDAVICMGNSFAHMLDTIGDQREQQLALNNFERCVKPGGLLLIDHRNYDNIMESGQTPSKSIYYNVSLTQHSMLKSSGMRSVRWSKLTVLATI